MTEVANSNFGSVDDLVFTLEQAGRTDDAIKTETG